MHHHLRPRPIDHGGLGAHRATCALCPGGQYLCHRHGGRAVGRRNSSATRPAAAEALAARAPDAGGIHLVPAFTGLGAPHWNDTARPADRRTAQRRRCAYSPPRRSRPSPSRCATSLISWSPNPARRPRLCWPTAAQVVGRADLLGTPVVHRTLHRHLRARHSLPGGLDPRHLAVGRSHGHLPRPADLCAAPATHRTRHDTKVGNEPGQACLSASALYSFMR